MSDTGCRSRRSTAVGHLGCVDRLVCGVNFFLFGRQRVSQRAVFQLRVLLVQAVKLKVVGRDHGHLTVHALTVVEHETRSGVERLHGRLATINFQHVIEHRAVQLTRLSRNLGQSLQTLDVFVLHILKVKVVKRRHRVFFGSDGLAIFLGQECDLALKTTA